MLDGAALQEDGMKGGVVSKTTIQRYNEWYQNGTCIAPVDNQCGVFFPSYNIIYINRTHFGFRVSSLPVRGN